MENKESLPGEIYVEKVQLGENSWQYCVIRKINGGEEIQGSGTYRRVSSTLGLDRLFDKEIKLAVEDETRKIKK